MIAKQAKTRTVRNGAATIAQQDSGSGERSTIKSTLPAYKVEKWAQQFKTMQKDQENVQKGLKIGYQRYCSKDKVRKAYQLRLQRKNSKQECFGVVSDSYSQVLQSKLGFDPQKFKSSRNNTNFNTTSLYSHGNNFS